MSIMVLTFTSRARSPEKEICEEVESLLEKQNKKKDLFTWLNDILYYSNKNASEAQTPLIILASLSKNYSNYSPEVSNVIEKINTIAKKHLFTAELLLDLRTQTLAALKSLKFIVIEKKVDYLNTPSPTHRHMTSWK